MSWSCPRSQWNHTHILEDVSHTQQRKKFVCQFFNNDTYKILYFILFCLMHEMLCCGTFDKVSLLLIVHLVLSNNWFGSDLDSGSYCIRAVQSNTFGVYASGKCTFRPTMQKKKKKVFVQQFIRQNINTAAWPISLPVECGNQVGHFWGICQWKVYTFTCSVLYCPPLTPSHPSSRGSGGHIPAPQSAWGFHTAAVQGYCVCPELPMCVWNVSVICGGSGSLAPGQGGKR